MFTHSTWSRQTYHHIPEMEKFKDNETSLLGYEGRKLLFVDQVSCHRWNWQLISANYARALDLKY